jgi:hypothetical protein
VQHLARREIGEAERIAIRQGRTIPGEPALEGPVALLAGGELVAIANPVADLLQPAVVLES